MDGKPKSPASIPRTVRAVGRLVTRSGLPVFNVYLNRRLVSLTDNTAACGLGFNRHNTGRPIGSLRANGVDLADRGRNCTISRRDLDRASLLTARHTLGSNAGRNIGRGAGPIFSIRCRPRTTPKPRSTGCLFSRFMSVVGTIRKKGRRTWACQRSVRLDSQLEPGRRQPDH